MKESKESTWQTGSTTWLERIRQAVKTKEVLRKHLEQAEMDRLEALSEGVRVEGSWEAVVNKLRESGEVE